MTNDMTNDELLDTISNLVTGMAIMQRSHWEAEQELLKNMSNDGATEYIGRGVRAVVSRSVSYDQARLVPILEMDLAPQEELESVGAYTPEHEETITRTVPARWNLTKLKPFAKRGAAVAEIIEGAQLLGNPTLKITQMQEGE